MRSYLRAAVIFFKNRTGEELLMLLLIKSYRSSPQETVNVTLNIIQPKPNSNSVTGSRQLHICTSLKDKRVKKHSLI
jgi:hypothetical protein